jgi:hypothetical protein
MLFVFAARKFKHTTLFKNRHGAQETCRGPPQYLTTGAAIIGFNLLSKNDFEKQLVSPLLYTLLAFRSCFIIVNDLGHSTYLTRS